MQDQIGEQISASPVDYPASSITADGIRQGVEDLTGDFSDRTLDVCATGDAICGGAGNGNGTGHLSYGRDVEDAAAFIAEQLSG